MKILLAECITGFKVITFYGSGKFSVYSFGKLDQSSTVTIVNSSIYAEFPFSSEGS